MSHPAPSEPVVDAARTPRRVQSWTRTWIVTLAAFGVALALVYALPLGDDDAARPDVQQMFVAGIAIAAVTTAALFAVIRLELRLPASVAVLCVVFNALVVGVKFVAAPNAVYEANAKKVFEVDLSLNDSLGGWAVAGLVFVLYAAVLFLIYRFARRRSGLVAQRLRDARSRRGVVVGTVAALVLLVAGLATGVGLYLAIIGLSAGGDYLGYVFGSGTALLVAVALALAASAATVAFGRAGELARAAEDVGILVSLFWICLLFLALYHVLWVVYILLITSLWPLKVVTPK
jgi:hypothetical protein